MKKLFTLLLAFLLPLFSHADDSGTCGDGLTYTYEESTQTLTITGNGAMSNYSYNESPWISYKTDIKAINIAEGGTSIGDYSFYGCSGLTSITISKSVTSIGKNAFYGCSGLTTITIPESVTSIGNNAFYGCSGLTTITIPESVTSIGKYAFQNCDKLSSVTINSNSVMSKSYTYETCLSTIFGFQEKSYILGESVTCIGKNAFCGCALTSITIPSSVTIIEDGAFQNCSLKSITIPEGVTNIGSRTFEGSKLSSITIPESVTNIGDVAFYHCSNLTSATIGNGVKSIGYEAFYDCSNLSTITIGNGVTNVGGMAFYGCSNLTTVNISDIESWCKISFNDYTSNPLYYAQYLLLNGEDIIDLEIPNTVTSICISGFYNCGELKSLTIPESVTTIGEGAFYQCNSLEKVTYLSPSPFILDKAIFPTQFKTGGTLYIPAGTRQTYVERGWSGYFFNIVEMEEGEPIWLTIMDAEQGHTKLKCESGKSYSLQFEPSDGWHIHSVTYRGTDVTDWLTEENVFTTPAILQSAELNITYAEGSTRVMNVKAESDIRVLVNDDYIVVRGVDAGTLIHVYDLNGRQISSTKAGDGETRIAVNTNEHVLLIKVGDQVVKVAR